MIKSAITATGVSLGYLWMRICHPRFDDCRRFRALIRLFYASWPSCRAWCALTWVDGVEKAHMSSGFLVHIAFWGDRYRWIFVPSCLTKNGIDHAMSMIFFAFNLRRMHADDRLMEFFRELVYHGFKMVSRVYLRKRGGWRIRRRRSLIIQTA